MKYHEISCVSCTPCNIAWNTCFKPAADRCHFFSTSRVGCFARTATSWRSSRKGALLPFAEGGLRVPLLFTLVCGAGSFYGDYFLEFGLRCAAWTSTSSSSGWALHHLLPLRGQALHLRGFLRAGALGLATWSSTCW